MFPNGARWMLTLHSLKAFLSSGYFYTPSKARETEAQSGILSCPGQKEHLQQGKELQVSHPPS